MVFLDNTKAGCVPCPRRLMTLQLKKKNKTKKTKHLLFDQTFKRVTIQQKLTTNTEITKQHKQQWKSFLMQKLDRPYWDI